MIPPKTLVFALAAFLMVANATGTARAQESLAPPVPFPAEQTPPVAPGPGVFTELAAQRALETGLPSIAAEIYRQLLDAPANTATPQTHNRVILALATALIEDDRIEEASGALQQFSGAPTPAVILRRALIDARARRFEEARAAIASLQPEDLPQSDRPWLFFMRGMLAEEAGDYTQASQQYQQAETSTATDAQRSWFMLSRRRVQLFLGQAGENTIASLRQTIDRNPGRRDSYGAISQLAVALNAANRRSEAVTLLQTQLQFLPQQETAIRDEWRLLLGLIAGADDNSGRDALRKLLADSGDHDKQRAALRLLANASQTKERATEFHNWLNQFIAATPPHPILDDLLLFRAQLALAGQTGKDFDSAEADASRLLAEFPGSPLRAAALGVQTAIAWEQGRYRAAADWAARARAELKSGPVHARLGVLIAEAYFRAKDFRNASGAYGSALADVPEGVAPGMLMFQRVLSEIHAHSNGGPLAAAQKVLDDYSSDERFDPVNRWQAEWNLSRALQTAGETAQAYARVSRLLAEPAGDGALPAGLRARMAWLQMRLAHDSGNYEQAIAHAEKIKTSLDDVAPELRADIISMALLLEVEAGYALAQPGQSPSDKIASTLRLLRGEYPKTAAAIRSYIIEADQAARRGQIVEAQGLLRKLADDYKGTPYASYALYQAAIYAESRAQDQYYREAYRLLEDLVLNEENTNPGAHGELVFYARLRQGNLLRTINEYGHAIETYRDLINRYKFPEFRDALIAELALADCYAAIASSDASRAESAAAIYERLLDLPAAPVDLRVEAGYKFGLNLIARNTPARLETIWWQMINDFLLDDTQAAKLGPKGRYWMSRTLLRLGEMLEQQSKFTQAREAYQLIITKNLPGATLAQNRIMRGNG
ncbi:tetratricopeptide (TPR) repeat protein [Ereboglobus sp. PH5-5]|uniref:tetratricopeptide repeat protein n=1 Tax=Ereboglobus sp. PH5-5 TaxID=2940529 RepID=UPI002405C847|nr:hypothetical protein [Ereboglobus sp. PH5-5]MDF9832385.1 tetratricopeptide (TPR) repeat protein [Ereboglobus sp. PH5-5]